MPPSDRDGLKAASLGGVVGVLAFACSLGFGLVNPGHTDWLTAGDLRIHFLGWHTFRSAPWQLPPGANPYFGYPVGTSVALTDSIPVFAMTFKLIEAWLPARFQYIGLWLLLSHLLQGVFGALLVRCVTPRWVLQVLGAALFVMAPVLLHRTGHPALGAHWVLLAALWLHFRSRDARLLRSRPALGWWAMLIAVVAATHPYLGFMVLALLGAHLGSVALRADGRQRVSIGAIFAASLGWYAVVSWLSGYFVVGSGSDLVGENFGEYSINVLSPIAPLDYSTLLGPIFFPTVVQTIEGYSYLGIGVIALAVPAAIGWARRPGGSDQSPLPAWPLILVLLVLAAMALGPVVHMGNTVAFRYPEELWGPLRLFRANGRMFWPALYGITFAIVAGVCRLRPTLAMALLTAAVAAQAADVSRAYTGAQELQRTTWQTPLAAEFWRAVTPSYRHLVAIPPNTCSPQGIDFLPVALLAGDHGLSVNAAMAARYDAEKLRQYCSRLSNDIVEGRIDPDALYVVQPASAVAFMQNATDPLICARVDGYVACVHADSASRWQNSVSVALERVP